MIYVDPRIGSGELLEDIRSHVNGQAEMCGMDAGDFSFEGNGPGGEVAVGIERKKIRDMLTSMRSGRFAGDQLVKMGQVYDVIYLIVEGLYRPGKTGILETWVNGSGWAPLTLAAKGKVAGNTFTYAELDKHLWSLEMLKNVVVRRSSNPQETAWQVANCYQQWRKPWDSHRSTDAIKLQTEVSVFHCSLLRKMASEMPGVGWERSKKVEAHFREYGERWFEAMGQATMEEWQGVLGPKTGENVYRMLRSKR